MKAEQIIYTSCKRGIARQSSGYQIYSYSPSAGQWVAQNNGIGVLQQYNAPSGPEYPMLPTPEQLEELYPKRTYCGPLSGPDNLYGLALCSYIGKDYPEGSIRGGNFISHAAVLPISQVDHYPCEFIESSSFMRTMDVEKARSDAAPNPLSQLDLQRNDDISFSAVQSFLEQEDHAETFKLMLSCFLTRQDGGGLKRIIIRSDSWNFSLWIAALQMALPLRQSLTYPFSTYETDLNATDAHVVRVADDMTGSLTQFAPMASIFDEENEIPFPQPAVDDAVKQVVDFIVEAMQYAPQSLKAFHDFLDATSYAATDNRIADAYNVFQICSGLSHLSEIDVEQTRGAITFLTEYCSQQTKRKFADAVFEAYRESLLAESQQTLLSEAVAGIAADDPSYLKKAQERSLDLIFQVFSDDAPSEPLYQQAHGVARTVFAAAGKDIDVVLFDELTDNSDINLGLNAPTNARLPWTVQAYAQWTANALLAAVQSGVGPRLGTSVQDMQASLGRRNASALDKLVAVIVRHPDTAGTDTLVQNFAASLESDSRLGCLIDLLIVLAGTSNSGVVEGSASSNITKAYNAFRALYGRQSDEQTMIGYLQTCCMSGLSDVAMTLLSDQASRSSQNPQSFVEFLKNALPCLPPDFVSRYSQQLTSACATAFGDASALAKCECMEAVMKFGLQRLPWYENEIQQVAGMMRAVGFTQNDEVVCERIRNLVGGLQSVFGVAPQLPSVFGLIWYQLQVRQLDDVYSTKKPDNLLGKSLAQTIMQQGPLLPIGDLGQDWQKFITGVSDHIVQPVLLSQSGLDLQLFVMPQSHVVRVMKRVMQDVIERKNMDDILLLLSVDAFCLSSGTNPTLSAQEIADCAWHDLFVAKVKSAGLHKEVDDQKRFDRQVVKRFENTYGKRFPKQAFDNLLQSVFRGLENYEDENPGLFKKLFGKK